MIVKLANLIAIRRDRLTNKLSSDDICNMFNEFLIQFERMEKSGTATTKIFLDAVEDIIDAVLSILPYKLLDPKVLTHPLMHFIHQLLITIVDNWCISHLRINIQETDIFLKIVLFFVHIAEQATTPNTEEDEKTRKELLTMKQLLFKVREQIDDIILDKESLDNDPNIWAVGLLTVKLLQGSPFYYSLGNNQRLINDLIMNSLDSYDYQQVIRQLQRDQSLPDIDYYLFFICWQLLSSMPLTKQKSLSQPTSINLIYYLIDELLTQLEQTFNGPSLIAPPSVAYIFQRCDQLLNVHNLPSFDKHANQIIDRLTIMLQEQSLKTQQDNPLIMVVLEAFYKLAQNADIRTIIKNRRLMSLFAIYTSTDNIEQRHFTFAILAQIMNEKEISSNPVDITIIFVNQLKQFNSNQNNSRTESALTSLKALMQHEQVKGEFIKQGGLETLTTFVRDGDASKQSDSQLEDALNILWSCTFNNPEVIKTLQQDEQFMARINQIQEKAKEEGNSSLEKAAEGLIWKVEQEEKFKQQQEQQAHQSDSEGDTDEKQDQYDMMISYSWADMDLAHRIFHHLTDKLGYKVWLDQQQMHGSTIQAMANAVDHSQFILMCMSETYKRSANCQSEAEYAFNRKKHIVPCKMKKDYAADGWLGFILGSRMYIDFGNYEFEKAMELLDNEIRLKNKKHEEATNLATKVESDEQNTSNVTFETDSDFSQMDENTNSENVLNWNECRVRDFLIAKNLSELLPLCNGINGKELVDLYGMCKFSSVAMYRSLRFELLAIHDKVLSISVYLHFLDRLRSLCDDNLSSNSIIYKKHLEEYFQDNE